MTGRITLLNSRWPESGCTEQHPPPVRSGTPNVCCARKSYIASASCSGWLRSWRAALGIMALRISAALGLRRSTLRALREMPLGVATRRSDGWCRTANQTENRQSDDELAHVCPPFVVSSGYARQPLEGTLHRGNVLRLILRGIAQYFSAPFIGGCSQYPKSVR
jgi:hypothetical protein